MNGLTLIPDNSDGDWLANRRAYTYSAHIFTGLLPENYEHAELCIGWRHYDEPKYLR